MCSQYSTKMILLGLTLSCMILSVQPQQYPPNTQTGPYTHGRVPENVHFVNDRTGSISPSAIKYDYGRLAPYYNSAIQSSPVQVTKSKEIFTSTTVQQPTTYTDRTVTNYRGTFGQSIQEQLDRSSTSQGQIPQFDKYNGLLYSVTNVGINVLQTINNMKAGNVVVSPYSISLLLSLLQQRARGETLAELTSALRLMPSDSAQGFSRISSDYKRRHSRNILNTATSIFVGDQFSISNAFKKIAQEKFDSDIQAAPYSTNPDQAARKINKWVSKQTNQKIDNLIAPESLDPNTEVILVNTIYFKGLWEVPFRPKATLTRDFQLGSGEIKSAQFMRMRNVTKGGVDPNTHAKVVIMPFVDNQYSMMLVLPPVSLSFSEMLATLTDARLLSYLIFEPTDAELEIPKFKVRGDENLATVLQSMGIRAMFSNNAELDLAEPYQGFSQTSRISSAVHSAVLSIDEEGGTAAAATGFAAVALSYDEPEFSFKANRPFLAVLWDVKSGIPLFMAKIEDPTL